MQKKELESTNARWNEYHKDTDTVKEIFSDDVIYSECYGPVYKSVEQIIRWF
jgi:hypothetical protein